MPSPHSEIDVIPDIHGDIDRLTRTLIHLGYQRGNTGWLHPKGRIAAFLGDLIDGGDQNGLVIETVRAMEASGNAIAILGNHELNALLFHGKGDNAERAHSGFMRAHSVNNVRQHESFLREFPVGAKHTLEALEWFHSLPVFLDLGPIRLVHAYWDSAQIEIIRERNADGRLRSHDLQELAFEDDATPFAAAVLASLKGPELELPAGCSFTDRNGRLRTSARLKWWQAGPHAWPTAVLSVPNAEGLPNLEVSDTSQIRFYPQHAKPVFFGHYKMSGQPMISATNALCLDYPYQACAYCWNGEHVLQSDNLKIIPQHS